METGWWFVGVDLGQSRDFTALAVLERAELTGEFDPAMFAWRKKIALRLRCLERAPLGTPYPEIVERVSCAEQRHLPRINVGGQSVRLGIKGWER